MLNFKRKKIFLKYKGFTLIELSIVMGLSFMLLMAVWSLFRISYNTNQFTDDELSAQRAVRIVLENLKSDLRSAVFPDGLVGDKFIIQAPFSLDGKEVGGNKIRFAKFSGFDSNGKPIIEKIMYNFDIDSGKVKRSNWSGKWEQKNNTCENEKVFPTSLSGFKNSAGESYLYFNTFYTDTDKQGFKGRLYVFAEIKAVYGKHVIKAHTVIGSRYITSKDREPFWNYNPMSKLNPEDFNK